MSQLIEQIISGIVLMVVGAMGIYIKKLYKREKKWRARAEEYMKSQDMAHAYIRYLVDKIGICPIEMRIEVDDPKKKYKRNRFRTKI